MSFWVFCVYSWNHYPYLLAIHKDQFSLLIVKADLSSLTMQVTLIPLGLVPTQVLMIFHSTRQWCFFQKPQQSLSSYHQLCVSHGVVIGCVWSRVLCIISGYIRKRETAHTFLMYYYSRLCIPSRVIKCGIVLCHITNNIPLFRMINMALQDFLQLPPSCVIILDGGGTNVINIALFPDCMSVKTVWAWIMNSSCKSFSFSYRQVSGCEDHPQKCSLATVLFLITPCKPWKHEDQNIQ